MNNKYLLVPPFLFIFAIIDILLVVAGRGHDAESLLIVNLAFLMVLVSVLITPRGSNPYVFAVRGPVISMVNAASQVVLCLVLMLTGVGESLLLVQGAVFAVAIVLYVSTLFAKPEAVEDEVRDSDLHSVRIMRILNLAMGILESPEDRDRMKLVIAKLKHAAEADLETMEGLDGELTRLAQDILAAARSGDGGKLSQSADEMCSLIDSNVAMVWNRA